MWNQEQIKNHKTAAEKLYQIILSTFLYIQKNQSTVTEQEASQFISKEFSKNKLIDDNRIESQIVAFGSNTSFVHHFPGKNSAKLQLESLILIDAWARCVGKNTPYADITWMGYFGKKIPSNIQKTFNLVKEASNSSLKTIESSLKSGKIPTGQQIHSTVLQTFDKYGQAKFFPHSTGHSIGTYSPHGRYRRIKLKNHRPLHQNLAYSLEPALYYPNKFGIRTELNFLINSTKKLVITTPTQDKIHHIN